MKKLALTLSLLLIATTAYATTCTKLINATEAQIDTLIIGMNGNGEAVCGDPEPAEDYVAKVLADCTIGEKRLYVDGRLWEQVIKTYRRGEKIKHQQTLTEGTFEPAE